MPKRLASLLLVCLLALTACASESANEESEKDSTLPSQSAASDPSETDKSAEDFAEGKNALELTGPAEADTVPDMEPVTQGSPELPATVEDSAGHTVKVESADRILALDLYGTLTDTVIGLGLSDRLVGRSNSDTQKALEDLPVVTKDGHDLNVEAVLNLEPDLILTNTTIGSDALYQQLESAGVTVVRFDHVPSLDSIPKSIIQVGQTFGMSEEGEELAQHTSDELAEAKEAVDQLRAQTPREPRGAVLYVRGTAGVFFILGSDYGAADVIQFLGLDDVAEDNGITDLKPANAEALVSLDPEIILAMSQGVESTGGVDGLLDRPGMSATTAGANQRIITAADSQLLSYGPRTPQNLVALAEAIYTTGDEE